MSNQYEAKDPRYMNRPPFKSGEAVYTKEGGIFHVLCIVWSLEHKQWIADFVDANTGEHLLKRDLCGLMSKKEFFTRRIAA